MTQTQLVKLTLMLEARLEELSRRLRTREDISVERTPDVLNEIELSVERDLTIWSLDKRFAQQRYVTAALDRIADGTYGSCIRCTEEISVKRLVALPHALFCIICQESTEHSESEEPGVSKELVGVQTGIST